MNTETKEQRGCNLEQARSEYLSKGYTVLRGIYSPKDIAAWRIECERLWLLPGLLDDLNLRTEFRRNGADTFVVDRLDPVLDISPILLDAVLDQRLLEPLRILLGAQASLLKCKLIRKDPDTGGYSQHQDFLYWRWLQLPANDLCSVGIPLFPSNEESGGIELFPGYHKSLLPSADGNPDADFDIACVDISKGETPALEPGDALIFHALTPHRSAPNRSSHPRTLLLPSYANTSIPDLYAKYYMREVKRRCAEFVGFERYESTLKSVSARHDESRVER